MKSLNDIKQKELLRSRVYLFLYCFICKENQQIFSASSVKNNILQMIPIFLFTNTRFFLSILHE